MHRYGDGLAVLSSDGGRSHGYQGLSGRDGGHDAGLLLRLGDANGSRCRCGWGAASRGDTGLVWVDKEAAPCHSCGRRAVAIQQAGRGGGHTWPGNKRIIYGSFI